MHGVLFCFVTIYLLVLSRLRHLQFLLDCLLYYHQNQTQRLLLCVSRNATPHTADQGLPATCSAYS